MKNNLFLVLTIFYLSNFEGSHAEILLPLQSKITKSDVIKSDLKGAVKKITTSEYDVEEGKRVSIWKEVTHFDKFGNVLEEVSWDEGEFDGKLVC